MRPHLPQELQGAHKRPSAHLPAVHIGPLIQQQRQVTVALYPLQTGEQHTECRVNEIHVLRTQQQSAKVSKNVMKSSTEAFIKTRCLPVASNLIEIRVDTVLYCSVLSCTALYCTALYCTVISGGAFCVQGSAVSTCYKPLSATLCHTLSPSLCAALRNCTVHPSPVRTCG